MVIPLKKNCSKASTFSIHKKFHPPFASQSLMVLGDGQPQLPDLDFGGFSVAKTQKSQILSEKSLESHTHNIFQHSNKAPSLLYVCFREC